jgi:hypothetical protein
MTPRKGETPEELRARASGHDTPLPILSIRKGGWHDSGNGGGSVTRLILCTAKSYWNGSGSVTRMIPITDSR